MLAPIMLLQNTRRPELLPGKRLCCSRRRVPESLSALGDVSVLPFVLECSSTFLCHAYCATLRFEFLTMCMYCLYGTMMARTSFCGVTRAISPAYFPFSSKLFCDSYCDTFAYSNPYSINSPPPPHKTPQNGVPVYRRLSS